MNQSGLFVASIITDVLNAFTMVAMVGTLNRVQIRNHSRYKRLVLKVTLVVFFISSFCYLMMAIFNVFFVPIFINIDKKDSLIPPLMTFLTIPFGTKITSLIWTKIFHDDKCIIGKPNSTQSYQTDGSDLSSPNCTSC